MSGKRILLLMLGMLMVCGNSFSVELSIARQGVIQNVPLEAPYNGCLIVREGPGMEYPIKGHVANGDTVTIESAESSWYKISAPMTGYIWGTYVKVTDAQTQDTANMTRALSLETIVKNSDPWTREKNLDERQKLLDESSKLPIPGLKEQNTP